MNNLISGKEALIALANGQDVEVKMDGVWLCCDNFKATQIEYVINDYYEFRLKPHTIAINGIEVPAPFEPKDDCIVYILDDSKTINYRPYHYCLETDDSFDWIGVWKTEEEIKQVVAALRTVFGGKS